MSPSDATLWVVATKEAVVASLLETLGSRFRPTREVTPPLVVPAPFAKDVFCSNAPARCKKAGFRSLLSGTPGDAECGEEAILLAALAERRLPNLLVTLAEGTILPGVDAAALTEGFGLGTASVLSNPASLFRRGC